MEPILNQRDSGKRLLYIDFLNIAACFGVVAMHCTGKAISQNRRSFSDLVRRHADL